MILLNPLSCPNPFQLAHWGLLKLFRERVLHEAQGSCGLVGCKGIQSAHHLLPCKKIVAKDLLWSRAKQPDLIAA